MGHGASRIHRDRTRVECDVVLPVRGLDESEHEQRHDRERDEDPPSRGGKSPVHEPQPDGRTEHGEIHVAIRHVGVVLEGKRRETDHRQQSRDEDGDGGTQPG